MNFRERLKNLNSAQKEAVDKIDGPLLVVAGPGTGKTELLSMRAANILQKTDTSPENILCLTFTDSGVTAMRERLSEIIGSTGYKISVHTFHSFSTEIINQNREFFYRGSDFSPADEIASREILTEIFESLDYSNPLASKLNDEFTYLEDTKSAISELKRAGLTSDELITIINSNEDILDTVEHDLAKIFSDGISLKLADALAPIAKRVATLKAMKLPSGITPLINNLSLSIAHTVDEAVSTGKTNAITKWRNTWLEKDTEGNFVFKSRKRHSKLRSIAYIYFSYITQMEKRALFDFDDMILNVVHAMEVFPDLRYNLQEKYQYIMVDEYQDTNLAQLRILNNLTLNHLNNNQPNIMAVGDDDQAIYSFQGADVSNIHRFRESYPKTKTIVLTENYRSSQNILDKSRQVITQGESRLEDTMQISKQLTSSQPTGSIKLIESPSVIDERYFIASEIKSLLKKGQKPNDIAVIARKHQELINLVPYLTAFDIPVSYEKRDNVLEHEEIKTLRLMSVIIISLFSGDHDEVNSLLPELLAHPMFNIPANSLFQISLTSYKDHTLWIETLLKNDTLKDLANWLVTLSKQVPYTPLETMLDIFAGIDVEPNSNFVSPFKDYYLSEEKLKKSPNIYIDIIESLRSIRAVIRDYRPGQELFIADFMECIDTYTQAKIPIMSTRTNFDPQSTINLLTAHKSKGLEFKTVFIIGAVDSTWGEKFRNRSRLISYPENLLITPNSNSYSERLRLFYVAMTRAKQNLIISFAKLNDSGKEQMMASFLSDLKLTVTRSTNNIASAKNKPIIEEISWNDKLPEIDSKDLKTILKPILENYRLSATHLNTYLNIVEKGPHDFLLNCLLHFPSAKNAHMIYGNAIHRALQRAHLHLLKTGVKRPIEDSLGDFIKELEKERMSQTDIEFFKKRGADNLKKFLDSDSAKFNRDQKPELDFRYQDSLVGEAKITGIMDLVEINDQKITITDYKTGKPSTSWKGKSEVEKIKLHNYEHQLMFYQLLSENSKDYKKFDFEESVLMFVEPDDSDQFHSLHSIHSKTELIRFEKLVQAVWQSITRLDFPDTSKFSKNYKGILEFEDYLVDNLDK